MQTHLQYPRCTCAPRVIKGICTVCETNNMWAHSTKGICTLCETHNMWAHGTIGICTVCETHNMCAHSTKGIFTWDPQYVSPQYKGYVYVQYVRPTICEPRVYVQYGRPTICQRSSWKRCNTPSFTSMRATVEEWRTNFGLPQDISGNHPFSKSTTAVTLYNYMWAHSTKGTGTYMYSMWDPLYVRQGYMYSMGDPQYVRGRHGNDVIHMCTKFHFMRATFSKFEEWRTNFGLPRDISGLIKQRIFTF